MKLLTFLMLALPAFCAELSFEEKLVEATLPADKKEVALDFKFENKSGEAVKIARYEGSCSCMKVQVKGGKLAYKPGETGVVRALFDMGSFSGTVDKSVQIWLEGDEPQSPSVVLVGRIHIPVLVKVEPKTIRWEVGAEAEVKTIELTMEHEEPIRVTKVESANPNFELELVVVEEGQKYELKVTPKSMEKQTIGLISIETDCSIKKHAKQRAYVMVKNPVKAQN